MGKSVVRGNGGGRMFRGVRTAPAKALWQHVTGLLRLCCEPPRPALSEEGEAVSRSGRADFALDV